jgi:tRNA(Ile)-lysidine synthase
MGPHPAVAATRTAVADALAGIALSAPVVVACSGGADSTALAAATAFVARRGPRSVTLATVDHALQPGSGDRAQDVAQLGRSLGLSVAVLTVQVADGPGAGGPEAAARAARYRALDGALSALRAPGGPDPVLLLGHTLDDQAETVLLGLGRGAGPRSLAGMAAASPRTGGLYLRPFLGVQRVVLRAACAAQGLPVWDDPHNGDPRFRRVRLRAEALPLLEDVLGGGVAGALARTAALLRDDLEALDALGCELLDRARSGDGLRVDVLAAAPRALRTRALRRWLGERGPRALGYPHLAEADGLLSNWHGQRGVDLPGGYALARASGRLVLHDAARSRDTADGAPQSSGPPSPEE